MKNTWNEERGFIFVSKYFLYYAINMQADNNLGTNVEQDTMFTSVTEYNSNLFGGWDGQGQQPRQVSSDGPLGRIYNT